MERRGKRWLVGVFILSLCLVSPHLLAEQGSASKARGASAEDIYMVEPQTDKWESMGLIELRQGNVRRVVYVVQTGDTLWDIAKRFLNSPFYWPKIWERNDFIINPHRIYPGDTLIIFPEVISEYEGLPPPPPTTERGPQVSYLPMGGTGFISVEELEAAGEIVDNPQHKVMLGERETAYVDVGKAANVVPGDKFTIFRVQKDIAGQPRQVKHPVTGEVVGYKIIILGFLELTKVEAKVSEGYIFESYQEIEQHDRIMPYAQLAPAPESVPVVGTDVEMAKGYIIASKNDTNLIGRHDVVYVDLGAKDNLRKGNVLLVYKPCEWVKDGKSGEYILLPHKVIGELLVVLEPQKTTAVALVLTALQEFSIGERVLLSKYNQWEIEGLSRPEEIDRCRVNSKCRMISAEEYANGMESPFCERPKSPAETEKEKRKKRADK